jgi:RHS repeat-associated protein
MNLAQWFDYAPYGSVIATTNTGQTAGRQYINRFADQSNLDYLNARYYNPAQGQFITQDPVFWSSKQNLSDPQSLNSYSYASNNPISKEDPDGLLTQAQSSTLTGIVAQLQGILGAISAIRAIGGSLSSGQVSYIQQTIASAQSTVTNIKNGGGATVVPSATTWAPQSGGGITPTNNITNSGPIPANKSDTSIPINSFGVCGGGSVGLVGFGSGGGCAVVSRQDYGIVGSAGGGGSTGIATGFGFPIMISNANSVKDLEGIDINGGFSTPVFQADYGHDPKGSVWSLSAGPSFGLKTSIPFLPYEAHGGAQKSWVLWSHGW